MPDIKQPTVIGDACSFGVDVLIWHWVTIGYGCVIGDYVVIGSHCYIGNCTHIGAESRIQSHVFLPNHTKIAERVFLGPGVVATDDKYPRVNNHDYNAEPPVFEYGCSVGAGAVILPGVRIGKGAMVGAGCVVTEDVPAYGVVVGNPSRIIRIRIGEKEHVI